MQQAFKPRLTADDYLSGKLSSDIRRENVDGEVYAMAGADAVHG